MTDSESALCLIGKSKQGSNTLVRTRQFVRSRQGPNQIAFETFMKLPPAASSTQFPGTDKVLNSRRETQIMRTSIAAFVLLTLFGCATHDPNYVAPTAVIKNTTVDRVKSQVALAIAKGGYSPDVRENAVVVRGPSSSSLFDAERLTLTFVQSGQDVTVVATGVRITEAWRVGGYSETPMRFYGQKRAEIESGLAKIQTP
jgi:hypothetical protein